MCSHVAAVLFKVEMAVRLGHTSASCTSVPCSWNQASIKKVFKYLWHSTVNVKSQIPLHPSLLKTWF